MKNVNTNILATANTTVNAHPTFLVELSCLNAKPNLRILLDIYSNARPWGVGPIEGAVFSYNRDYALAAVTLCNFSADDAEGAYNALCTAATKYFVGKVGKGEFANVLDAEAVEYKHLWTKVQGLEGQLVYHQGSLAMPWYIDFLDEGGYHPLVVVDGGLVFA